ncbi:MAG: hypothetical protein KDA77_11285 [Planctomycetaceae bacterium]|nr:hypothetical protein [Planctomycetaceae bacterium]
MTTTVKVEAHCDVNSTEVHIVESLGTTVLQDGEKHELYVYYYREVIVREVTKKSIADQQPHFKGTDQEDRMMKWFAFDHLPGHLKAVSGEFHALACTLTALVEPGPERTVALRKLLEAKDAAVRAKISPGG